MQDKPTQSQGPKETWTVSCKLLAQKLQSEDDEEEGGFYLKGDDQMVNDAELADLMKFREMCASGDCKAMPSKQKMQIKV